MLQDTIPTWPALDAPTSAAHQPDPDDYRGLELTATSAPPPPAPPAVMPIHPFRVTGDVAGLGWGRLVTYATSPRPIVSIEAQAPDDPGRRQRVAELGIGHLRRRAAGEVQALPSVQTLAARRDSLRAAEERVRAAEDRMAAAARARAELIAAATDESVETVQQLAALDLRRQLAERDAVAAGKDVAGLQEQVRQAFVEAEGATVALAAHLHREHRDSLKAGVTAAIADLPGEVLERVLVCWQAGQEVIHGGYLHAVAGARGSLGPAPAGHRPLDDAQFGPTGGTCRVTGTGTERDDTPAEVLAYHGGQLPARGRQVREETTTQPADGVEHTQVRYVDAPEEPAEDDEADEHHGHIPTLVTREFVDDRGRQVLQTRFE